MAAPHPSPARVALVTGAARGIGAATVTALAGSGWSVLAVDLVTDIAELSYPLATDDDLAAVVRPGVHPFRADVRDPAALHAAVAEAELRFGGLDAAIACAGVIAGGVHQPDLPISVEQAVLDINLGGVLNLSRAAIPALLRRPEPRSGRFLAVASSAANHGLPLLAAYCAAKAGVTGLIRALAAELAGTGITANTVSPGSTDTDLLVASARIYGLPTVDRFASQQAVRRLLDPSEIAAVLAFLASDAAGAITGAEIAADGGFGL